MFRILGLISICLMTLSALGQSTSTYEVATIVDVKTHQAVAGGASGVPSYDVSIKVGNTIYLVFYTPQFGIDTIKYKTGRNLLVLVGKNVITYNDILGQSIDVPIVSQRPAVEEPK